MTIPNMPLPKPASPPQPYPSALIQNKINSSQDILIVLPQMHTLDILAASLGLYLTLKDSKTITIACSGNIDEAGSNLFSADVVQDSPGGKNLVITLDTPFDDIDKVTTDDHQGKFNLAIELKPEKSRLSQKDISFSYRGLTADLIIAVGCLNSQQLGKILSQEPNLLTGREIITISHQAATANFGTINLSDPQASGCSEIIVKLLKDFNLELPPEATTNLLAGIEIATNSFSFRTGPDTFSAAGWCMQRGAKRGLISPQQPQAPRPFNPRMPSGFPQQVPSGFPQQMPTMPTSSPNLAQFQQFGQQARPRQFINPGQLVRPQQFAPSEPQNFAPFSPQQNPGTQNFPSQPNPETQTHSPQQNNLPPQPSSDTTNPTSSQDTAQDYTPRPSPDGKLI
jgi:nanoRNase/pAp phosphatase (c-di-AMP/oligoRNAs hydrolase)